MAKQKVIPQELQEALNSQQQLCAEIIEDKKKLINDLQQELKGEDDRYVKDMRRQAEELDVMMERMEEQIKTLTQAYREEIALTESVYHQEREVLHTRHRTDWEQYTEDLRDKQQVRLTEKKKKVEEYEAKIYELMMETIDKFCILSLEENAKYQILERELQQIKAKNMITTFEQMKQNNDIQVNSFNLSHMKSRIASLHTKVKNLKSKYTSQKKQFRQKNWYLSEEYKRNIQQYERIQKKISHFAVADAKKFEEMWLMIDAELKQLVEGALVIDSLIYKQHLGLDWERPHMPFMELSGPLQPHKQAQRHTRQAVSQLFQSGQAVQCSHGMMDASVGPRLGSDAESIDMEVCRQGRAAKSAAVEEVSMETMKKLMELLCDESGFLMEDKVLDLLAPLEKDEQTVVKLGSLLCAFGIDEVDVPKLADFLSKYKPRQKEPTEDVCAESGESTSSTTYLTPKSVHPNHVLPALKSFLKHYRESSARQQPSFQCVEVRDTSEDEAYWESMGNVVSEDKVRLWEALENILKQHLAVLTEISELIPETQSLQQQNTELRMLLHQSLNSNSVQGWSPDTELVRFVRFAADWIVVTVGVSRDLEGKVFLPLFSEISIPLGPQQFLDKVARHAVEEEAQHDQQQQGQHDLDDQPLVTVAHQIADGFQRAQEPQEGGVWAARWEEKVVKGEEYGEEGVRMFGG
ncbi:hypothetical protein PAMA_006864 [Pampus argenteus]